MTDLADKNRAGLLLGMAIAIAVPLASLVVAYLWDHGVLALEPNGAFVQILEGSALWEIVLGPLGIVIVGRSAHVRGSAWIGLFLIAIPSLFALWFVSVAYLGGLAGEPF